jgi:hypothetical protein
MAAGVCRNHCLATTTDWHESHSQYEEFGEENHAGTWTALASRNGAVIWAPSSDDKNEFYVLFTVHHVLILGEWATWRIILFYVFIFIFNSLHTRFAFIVCTDLRTDSGICCMLHYVVARGGVVVKVLRYKPAGRGFDSRCCHWNFSVT